MTSMPGTKERGAVPRRLQGVPLRMGGLPTLVAFLVLAAPASGVAAPAVPAGEAKAQAEVRVEGAIVEAIGVAFDHYRSRRNAEVLPSRYFVFTASRKGGDIVVEIDWNREVLLRDLGHTFKGGGAKYVIDAKRFTVKDVTLYK